MQSGISFSDPDLSLVIPRTEQLKPMGFSLHAFKQGHLYGKKWLSDRTWTGQVSGRTMLVCRNKPFLSPGFFKAPTWKLGMIEDQNDNDFFSCLHSPNLHEGSLPVSLKINLKQTQDLYQNPSQLLTGESIHTEKLLGANICSYSCRRVYKSLPIARINTPMRSAVWHGSMMKARRDKIYGHFHLSSWKACCCSHNSFSSVKKTHKKCV